MKIKERLLKNVGDNFHIRQSFWQLTQYAWFFVGIMVLFAVIFQFLMIYVEGEHYSWVTAFYWTMMVMSTLGFGDVAFSSDIGRAFTIVVLTTGIVQLMVLLPFFFIRFGPWLEKKMQIHPPGRVPVATENHVIVTSFDGVIVPDLIERFRNDGIPLFIIQSDVETAVKQYVEGMPVIVGEPDLIDTYEALCVKQARLVIALGEDTVNTNTILTIREVDDRVPIVVIANQEQSIDILELSGATHVLPLKRWLGEQLANRVNSSYAQPHKIGQYENLHIAEVPIHRTPLANKTIRESHLRDMTGLNIIGVWQGSQLLPASADFNLTENQVIVVAGTKDQLELLEDILVVYDHNPNPVLVIGGGRVGVAAAKRLKRKEIPVHVVERNTNLREKLKAVCDRVFIGDAADYNLLKSSGIMEAPSVIITTNDDAMNIYLASYCRHLNNNIRIVSRITHERNLEAIHRAGADLVLRYSSLGIEAIQSILEERELMLLGEDIQFYEVSTPPSLDGKTLAGSNIGSQTGMIVLAMKCDGEFVPNPSASTLLSTDSILYMLGSVEQRNAFREVFQE